MWTSDGGARQPEADLWCSYASVRTLASLGERPADPDAVAAFLLSRRNADGAFAWQRGLASDVWATYYCTQALRDLGRPVQDPDRLAGWLERLRTPDGGFGMTPGQSADVWATYYAARTHAEVVGTPVAELRDLAAWLRATQDATGGLTWSPGNRAPDVRASYYGALAWRAAAGDEPAPWQAGRLVAWIRDRQGADGGFAFAPGGTSCAWAAFRAAHALRALGARPRDPAALRDWLEARWLDGEAYERWPGYGRADVWACFSAVGALAALGERPRADRRAATADFVRGCQLPGSGFTYRRPDAAGDSLATAAALLVESGSRAGRLAAWLREAQLPYEGGVMYMPGRGAEIRCTLWAAEALNAVGQTLDSRRLGAWLRGLQNVDGGFGYWQGRASDVVSTASAVETALAADVPPRSVLDGDCALRFLDTCRAGDGHGPVPGAGATLAATGQAARALHALGRRDEARAAAHGTDRWASPLGGYASSPRGVPDLLSTYQAVLTREALGLDVDRGALARFLKKVSTPAGYAWSPLGGDGAGPLATSLGTLLAGSSRPLPRLNL
jgi:prenyltransferase beta subunit